MRAAFEITWMDLKRVFKSPKLYLLMLFTVYFLRDFTKEVIPIAMEYQVGVSPYVYPLFYGQYNSRIYAMMVIVILMSDAPYIDISQKYTYIRSGIFGWLMGKCGYIVGISGIYQLLIILASVILLLPYLGITAEWGDVLRILGNLSTDITGTGGTQSSVSYIIENYSPFLAMFLAWLMATLVSSLMGMLIFLFNGVTKTMFGTFAALTLGLVDLFLSALREVEINLKLPNPVSWMDLSRLYLANQETGKMSFIYIFLLIICLIVIMIGMLYLLIRKKIINIAE